MTMRLITSLAAFVAVGVGAFDAQPVVPRPAKELEIVERVQPGIKTGECERPQPQSDRTPKGRPPRSP